MKKLLALALIITCSGFITGTAFANRTIGDLEFADDFQALLNKAEQSEKSILVKFYTDWCHWCKVMDDSTFPNSYVQRFLDNFELGMINAEKDTVLAARYGVRSYPTTILLKPNGVEIDRMVGYYRPEEFVARIVDAFEGVGTIEYYLEKLANNPESAELNYEVGQKYRWKGDYDKARAHFEAVIGLDADNSEGLAAQAAFNLGHMQYKLKNYLVAAELWQVVSREYSDDPISIDAEIMIAYAFQKAEEFEKAKQAYNAFLQKYPDTEERGWIEEQFAKMNGTE